MSAVPAKIEKAGVYDLPEEDYHADPCPAPSLSSSIVKVLLDKSPRHAWWRHPRRDPLRLRGLLMEPLCRSESFADKILSTLGVVALWVMAMAFFAIYALLTALAVVIRALVPA